MNKLLKTVINLTAIGVAVKVVRNENKVIHVRLNNQKTGDAIRYYQLKDQQFDRRKQK